MSFLRKLNMHTFGSRHISVNFFVYIFILFKYFSMARAYKAKIKSALLLFWRNRYFFVSFVKQKKGAKNKLSDDIFL
jgi:hypothetical protein